MKNTDTIVKELRILACEQQSERERSLIHDAATRLEQLAAARMDFLTKIDNKPTPITHHETCNASI